VIRCEIGGIQHHGGRRLYQRIGITPAQDRGSGACWWPSSLPHEHVEQLAQLCTGSTTDSPGSLSTTSSVRLALGASPAAVLRLVLGQGVRLTLLGLGLGLTAALGLTRLIRGLLFGVGATDPLSFGVAVAVLGAAALIACYGPGRRAARIDPVVALRVE
jgi:hypothetical protein